MEPKIVETITKNIHRRYPEVAGVKPTVRKQPSPKSGSKPLVAGPPNYLLTFKNQAKGPMSAVITCWVRVIAAPNGKIIKVTTSK